MTMFSFLQLENIRFLTRFFFFFTFLVNYNKWDIGLIILELLILLLLLPIRQKNK